VTLRLVSNARPVADIAAELELPTFVIDDAREAEIAALRARAEDDERERAREERHLRLLEAGWQPRELNAAREADESKQAIEHVKAWDASRTNILIVAGTKGCGKTTAAAWWAERQQRVPRFLSAIELSRSSRYDEAKRERVLKSHALVLDDLGAEWNDSKGSFRVDIDEVVNAFYRGLRPLLITTNIATVDEFRVAYGERVVDRLRECATWGTCTNESLRQRGPANLPVLPRGAR
jgi:DNA replication protein DnaC